RHRAPAVSGRELRRRAVERRGAPLPRPLPLRGRALPPAAPARALPPLRPQSDESVHVALPRPRLAVLQLRRRDRKRAPRARARGRRRVRARGLCGVVALSLRPRLSLRGIAAGAARAAALQRHRPRAVRSARDGTPAPVRAHRRREGVTCGAKKTLSASCWGAYRRWALRSMRPPTLRARPHPSRRRLAPPQDEGGPERLRESYERRRLPLYLTLRRRQLLHWDGALRS